MSRRIFVKISVATVGIFTIMNLRSDYKLLSVYKEREPDHQYAFNASTLGEAIRDISNASAVEEAHNATNVVIKPAPRQAVPSHRLQFVHLGKAGGGSVAIRIRQVWRLKVFQCHPAPCIAKKWRNARHAALPHMLLTLRDPVDRFVSAFYWRVLKSCHPEVDQRPAGWEKERCQSDLPIFANETKVLFYRYNQDASWLAEDLCSVNETTASIARQSLQEIMHAKFSLADWLDYNWRGEVIFPIVVEKGAEDLNLQVDRAIHWFHNETQGLTVFEQRRRFAQQHLRLYNEKNTHSASGAKKGLTPKAEQCLEQFYRKDYLLLQSLRDLACKTQACQEAIQNILNRRKRVFEEPLGHL